MKKRKIILELNFDANKYFEGYQPCLEHSLDSPALPIQEGQGTDVLFDLDKLGHVELPYAKIPSRPPLPDIYSYSDGGPVLPVDKFEEYQTVEIKGSKMVITTHKRGGRLKCKT